MKDPQFSLAIVLAILFLIVGWTFYFTAPCSWMGWVPTGQLPPRCISYFVEH